MKMVTHAKTICIMRIENYTWQVWRPLVKFGHYFTLWIKGLTSESFWIRLSSVCIKCCIKLSDNNEIRIRNYSIRKGTLNQTKLA